jgi:hypothetical protein
VAWGSRAARQRLLDAVAANIEGFFGPASPQGMA